MINKFYLSTKEFIQCKNRFDSNKKIDLITALIGYLSMILHNLLMQVHLQVAIWKMHKIEIST